SSRTTTAEAPESQPLSQPSRLDPPVGLVLRALHDYRRMVWTNDDNVTRALKVIVADVESVNRVIVPEFLLRHFPAYHGALVVFFRTVVVDTHLCRLRREPDRWEGRHVVDDGCLIQLV